MKSRPRLSRLQQVELTTGCPKQPAFLRFCSGQGLRCGHPPLWSNRVVLHALRRRPSSSSADVPEQLFRREFEAADTDHDGTLSFEEFQAMKRKPSMKRAMDMPRDFWEMSNEVLLLMAARGVHGAQKERLLREVMAVDRVHWEAAQPRLEEIERCAQSGVYWLESPFFVGIVLLVGGAILSVPMVFHHGLADWFYVHFVTAAHEPEKDLETWLEVGGWTWNWMEPVIGTLSFLILAAQLCRGFMINVRVYAPLTSRITRWQVEKVKGKYPQYHPSILEDYVGGLR